MPIILIQRETFRLLGTQTGAGLAHFELGEGTASDLPRGVVTPGKEGCRNAS